MWHESFDLSPFLAEKSPQCSVLLSSVSLPVPNCKDLSGGMKYRDHVTNNWNRFLKKAACKCLIGTLFKEKLQGEFTGEAVSPCCPIVFFLDYAVLDPRVFAFLSTLLVSCRCQDCRQLAMLCLFKLFLLPLLGHWPRNCRVWFSSDNIIASACLNLLKKRISGVVDCADNDSE